MPNGDVRLVWGDQEQTFNIAKLKVALELEEKCGCGVAEIFERIRSHRWHILYLRETLRLGLIGGGMAPPEALKTVTRYCDERPWQESVQPALVILMAAMVGVPGDDVGKKAQTERSQQGDGPSSETMADSSVPSSTVSAPPSGSIQEQSTN